MKGKYPGWGLLAPVFQPDEETLVRNKGGLNVFSGDFCHDA